MDFGDDGGFNGGNVDQENGGGFDNWGPPGFSDQGVWATEDEYRNWNTGAETPPDSSYDGRQSSSLSGSEPPSKMSRSSSGGDANQLASSRYKAIGKMFYKTKLCGKFRAGVCPYITNCNFAHGLEELRRPPPNWQEIVAAHEGERPSSLTAELREEHQIPTIDSPDSRLESQRSNKGRHCKKFYTEEGCPYGESCTFLHDEQSRTRESVAISVTPTVGSAFTNIENGQTLLKPSNWKTRICNKWETTGYCPFGSKCHFAHGAAELHKYGGGLADIEGKDCVGATPDAKQGDGVAKPTDASAPLNLPVPHTDIYHMGSGVPVQRSGALQRPGQRELQKWKGPDKISKIYGDWIDDLE
ncbi:hypothetical protein Leryth_000258 [Lithospermum erythrorhizon]|nr:hypothetical protein Leryth_000258 [Lithospermum erythrorhizon]